MTASSTPARAQGGGSIQPPRSTAARDTRLKKFDRSLLTDEQVRVLGEQLRKLLGFPFDRLMKSTGLSPEDHFRMRSLAARLVQARNERGLDLKAAAAALKAPRYRLQAIESGHSNGIDAALLVRYVEFAGLSRWFGRWKNVNAELATRLGLSAGGKRVATALKRPRSQTPQSGTTR